MVNRVDSLGHWDLPREIKGVNPLKGPLKEIEKIDHIGQTIISHPEKEVEALVNGKVKKLKKSDKEKISFRAEINNKTNTITIFAQTIPLKKEEAPTTLGHIEINIQPSAGEKSGALPSADTKEKYVHVVLLDTNATYSKKYKGVGTALMQVAMEYGKQHGCEGRMKLEAAWGSQRFYTDEIHLEGVSNEVEKRLDISSRRQFSTRVWSKEQCKQKIQCYETLLKNSANIKSQKELDAFLKKQIPSIKKEIQKNMSHVRHSFENTLKENNLSKDLINTNLKKFDNEIDKLSDALIQEIQSKTLKNFKKNEFVEALQKLIQEETAAMKKVEDSPSFGSYNPKTTDVYKMYLPQRAITVWEKRITANPMLEKGLAIEAPKPRFLEAENIGQVQIKTISNKKERALEIQLHASHDRIENRTTFTLNNDLGRIEFSIKNALSSAQGKAKPTLIIHQLSLDELGKTTEEKQALIKILAQATLEYAYKNGCDGELVFEKTNKWTPVLLEGGFTETKNAQKNLTESNKQAGPPTSRIFLASPKWDAQIKEHPILSKNLPF